MASCESRSGETAGDQDVAHVVEHGGATLRLITCGGSFDRGRRSYDDNVVVFATLV